MAQRVSAFRKTLQIWTSGFCALLKDWDGALATIAVCLVWSAITYAEHGLLGCHTSHG